MGPCFSRLRPRHPTEKSLCEHCVHIPISKMPEPLWVYSYKHQHLPNARDLAESSEKCQLCSLFLSVMAEAIQEVVPELSTTPLADLLHPQPLVLECEMESAGRHMPEGPRVTGLTIMPPWINKSLSSNLSHRLDLDLFADEDSPAATSGVVGARRPLDAHNSEAAFDLLNQWLHECLDNHTSCKLNVAGTALDEDARHEFPTRLLDVGDPADRSTVVRLRETRSLDSPGPYIALSHCWGAAETMSLTTTTDNLPQHMQEIPWDRIPRTFRDATEICRKVGIRYLWIDSLCIVQDDLQSWEQESVHMGPIYSRARLTIAASHAKDSREGCFCDRPVVSQVVKILFWAERGGDSSPLSQIQQGSVYIQQRPWKDLYDIHEQHLDTRAWITQEMILSRRKVYYTKARMIWECAEFGEDEAGRHARTGYGRDWITVVSGYSARLLTRDTDRLAAVQGLASELATARPGDTYVWGLWCNELPQQLLWHRRGTLRKAPDVLRIPSWSWAASIGPIKPSEFSRMRVNPETSTPSIAPIFHCRVVGVESFGGLILEGVVMPLPPVQRAWLNFDNDEIYVRGEGDSAPMTVMSELRPEWRVDCIRRFMMTGFGATWLMLQPDDPQTTLGMVSFDYDPDPDRPADLANIVCFLVLNGMRRDDWSAEYFLLLQPYADQTDTFARVGMGIFFPSSSAGSYFGGTRAQAVRVL